VAELLVDTDVFIDHLRGAAELKAGRNRLHYSVITRAELFAGNSATTSPCVCSVRSERFLSTERLPSGRSHPARDGHPVAGRPDCRDRPRTWPGPHNEKRAGL